MMETLSDGSKWTTVRYPEITTDDLLSVGNDARRWYEVCTPNGDEVITVFKTEKHGKPAYRVTATYDNRHFTFTVAFVAGIDERVHNIVDDYQRSEDDNICAYISEHYKQYQEGTEWR